MDCVKKLKGRLDDLIAKYASAKEEFESYNSIDVEKANEKLKLLRAKADQYEIQMTDAQMLDVMEHHGRLINSDDSKKLAELKVKVQAEKQE